METQATLQRVITKHSKFLAKKGFKITSTQFLGSGYFGGAYDIGNDIVMKITTDQTEATASKRLIGKKLDTVNEIYGVFRVPEKSMFKHYVILQAKLENMSAADGRVVDEAERILRVTYNADQRVVGSRKSFYDGLAAETDAEFKDRIDDMIHKVPDNEQHDYYTYWQFIYTSLMELRSHNVEYCDFHKGNLMKSSGGKLKVIDLGFSQSPNADIDVLESIRRQIQRILK
jgi:hypothetical protein